MLPFARVAIIGLGLIGSSIARAVRAEMPGVRLTGHDADPDVRATAERIALVDDVMTTGATLDAAARALVTAGACEVVALVVARTP